MNGGLAGEAATWRRRARRVAAFSPAAFAARLRCVPPGLGTGAELAPEPAGECRQSRKSQQSGGLGQGSPLLQDVTVREVDPNFVDDRRECHTARFQTAMNGPPIHLEMSRDQIAGASA